MVLIKEILNGKRIYLHNDESRSEIICSKKPFTDVRVQEIYDAPQEVKNMTISQRGQSKHAKITTCCISERN